MDKAGLLLLAQVDHLTGEELGYALEELHLPGVRNQQLIATQSKKGRPGFLLLLDIDPAVEAVVAQMLAEHLNIYGYHRLPTQHVFLDTVTRKVIVKVQHGDRPIEATIHLKGLAEGKPSQYLPESRDIALLKDQIKKELNVDISFMELRRRIEGLTRSSTSPTVLMHV